MKIQQKDYFHGAALTQIVEHESFKALNKADEKYGHYKINHDIRLMVKITSIEDEPWQFTANASDLATMEEDLNSGDQFFLCLVCGLNTICLLDGSQVKQLLDTSSREQQWLHVRNTGSLWVWSRRIELKNAIPHNAFPNKIFSI
jgi:hypothetical protein